MSNYIINTKTLFKSTNVGCYLLAGIFAFSTSVYSAQKAKPNNVAPKKPVATQRGVGVVAMFSAAQKLYNEGKFSEALVAFDKIMKKYPGHEPTIIQYAKTLYRLDRIPESYNLFARINPQYLDPETSYEYGYASYVNSRWDAALYGFKRVPSEHALYDLANYYGALSAIKLKLYADADEMLDKAVVLPDKLAKSRTMYQKHVQSLKRLQEKSELEAAEAAEKNRLNANKANSKAGSTQTQASATNTPKGIEPHGGFLEVVRKAKLIARKEHQVIDKHGFNQTEYDNEVGEFSFSYGPLVKLPWKSSETESSAVGLQLNLGVLDTSSKGRQERIVVYEDSRDIPRVLGDDIPASHTTIGTIGVDSWIEFALAHSWWTGISAGLNFDYPKFERGQRTSIRYVTPHFGKQFKLGPNSGSILATYRYEQLTDSETEPLVDTGNGTLNAEIEFPTKTTLSGTLNSYLYNYQLPTIDGPDSTFSGTLKVVQGFPLGIRISFSGTAASSKDYLVHGLATFGDATADNTALSGKAKFSATPFEWLTLSTEYQVAKTTWQIHQDDRIDAFKKNIPDYVEQSTFSGSLNFVF